MNTSKKIIAISCEVNDLMAPDARLIELAAVAIENGHIASTHFHAVINPEAHIEVDGTLVHGHSDDSVANCPTWTDIAPQWQAFAQGAQLLVWNAAFHLSALDRAQQRAGLPPMHNIVTHVVDLRELLAAQGQAPKLQHLLREHHIHVNPQHDSAMQQAQQLSQLWLKIGDALCRSAS